MRGGLGLPADRQRRVAGPRLSRVSGPRGTEGWRVAYIQYSDKPRHYRICKADKWLRNFSAPVDIQGVAAPQHGSFMRLAKKEYKRLEKQIGKKR